MWQLTAAEDGPPVPRAPASRSGGHSQACWAVFMRADGPQNQRQNAPPLLSVGLAASQPQVSGPPGGAAPLAIYPSLCMILPHSAALH